MIYGSVATIREFLTRIHGGDKKSSAAKKAASVWAQRPGEGGLEQPALSQAQRWCVSLLVAGGGGGASP